MSDLRCAHAEEQHTAWLGVMRQQTKVNLMIIEKGEHVHVIYRALYESSGRRHFLGEVREAEGAVCRVEGYVFVYDQKSSVYLKKPEKRITVMDLSESGYIVNIIDPNVSLESIVYKYEQGVGLVAVDGKGFSLNVNEFGAKS